MSTFDMKPPYAIEIVNYRLNEDADEARFLELKRAVGAEFTSAQPGFLRREIGRAEDGTWLIAVYWETARQARDSIANIETIPDTVKSYMALIDRGTLTRSIFEVV